jgi:hypothetical protein
LCRPKIKQFQSQRRCGEVEVEIEKLKKSGKVLDNAKTFEGSWRSLKKLEKVEGSLREAKEA